MSGSTHRTTVRSSGTTELTSGWAIRSSAETRDGGAEISRPDYSTRGWLPLSRPGALMAGLLENGRYADVFRGDGVDVNWWYREELTVRTREGGRTFLVVNGVSGKADLWINGTEVAEGARLQFARLEFDVTPYVRDGANAIALDLSPVASGLNAGLQGAPEIVQEGPVSVRNVRVLRDGVPDLTVMADVRNNTGTAKRVGVSGIVTRGSTRIACEAMVTVLAHATRTVAVTKADCPGLRLEHPWPYEMGDQPMYHLALDASVGGVLSSSAAGDFGIRTVMSRLTEPVPDRAHRPSIKKRRHPWVRVPAS